MESTKAKNCLDTCLILHSRGGGLIVKKGKTDHRAFVQSPLDDMIVNWKRSRKGQQCRPFSALCVYIAILVQTFQ